MLEGQASRTADRVALRRAAHQLWDNPKVLDDPIALQIIPADARAELAGSRPSDSSPGTFLRAFVVARSRFAEDHLAQAVVRGIKQYVVLGAGLDTFAYRNPFPDLHVFEVDYPATQAWKRQRLRLANISIPPRLTFAPVDFEKDTLHAGLVHAGFKSEEAAFFSWLGVTPYLAESTVFATLRWIATQHPQNGVAFDYAVPRASLTFFQRMAFDALSARVAAAGEPFVGFFDPETLSREIHQMGFKHVEDLDAEEINARYFGDRRDGLRVGGGLARLMCARG
ncbi:MAG TPA: class I SAM-dependent methyltransferase [Candidatus Angelobacter sp.]|nr:class I SAM-dependent methyltransferase [Candidatus Angelobacter sp.]